MLVDSSLYERLTTLLNRAHFEIYIYLYSLLGRCRKPILLTPIVKHVCKQIPCVRKSLKIGLVHCKSK